MHVILIEMYTGVNTWLHNYNHLESFEVCLIHYTGIPWAGCILTFSLSRRVSVECFDFGHGYYPIVFLSSLLTCQWSLSGKPREHSLAFPVIMAD